jgi:hypothetical protein
MKTSGSTWNTQVVDPNRTASNKSHKLRNTVWQDSVTPSGKVVGAKKFFKHILKENLLQN